MDILKTTAKRHYYLLTSILMFVSGITVITLALPFLAVLAWVSLVPLLLYVKEKPLKEVYFYAFIAGLIGNYLQYRWIGDFGANVAGGNFVIVGFVIPSLTVFFATRVLVAEFLSRKFESFRILVYPSVWIIIDWIQSLGHLAFPWAYIAYTQYTFTPFIQSASVLGILGINFIMVAVNTAVSELVIYFQDEKPGLPLLLRSVPFRRVAFFILLLVVMCTWGFFHMHSHREKGEPQQRAVMVQSCISPWENWNINRFMYLKALEDLTRDAMKHDPDVVIWSESATLESISFDYFNGRLDRFEKKVVDLADELNVPLLTGEIGIIEDHMALRYYPQNNLVYINEDGEVVATYPKNHLVPFGEWFPYQRWFPFVQKIIYAFGGSAFVPGDKPMMFNVNGYMSGNLVCYENIFYRMCRQYGRMGVDFFVNITNLGWTENPTGHMQHFAFSVFRAIENGTWFYSAGNTGYTAFIDPYGRITSSIPLMVKDYCTGDVNFALNHETVYLVTGDVILYLAIMLAGALGIVIFVSIWRKEPNR